MDQTKLGVNTDCGTSGNKISAKKEAALMRPLRLCGTDAGRRPFRLVSEVKECTSTESVYPMQHQTAEPGIRRSTVGHTIARSDRPPRHPCHLHRNLPEREYPWSCRTA